LSVLLYYTNYIVPQHVTHIASVSSNRRLRNAETGYMMWTTERPNCCNIL